MSKTKTDQLVSFLQGTGSDNHNRTLKDIWFFTDEQLENCHNYIQWMFPIDTISFHNPFAPTICKENLSIFQTEEIQNNMKTSLDIMLSFYGFTWQDDKIVLLDCYKEKLRDWVSYRNHNYLRITRILKSLCLVGLEEYASKFLEVLECVYKLYPDKIGTSINYWRYAR